MQFPVFSHGALVIKHLVIYSVSQWCGMLVLCCKHFFDYSYEHFTFLPLLLISSIISCVCFSFSIKSFLALPPFRHLIFPDFCISWQSGQICLVTFEIYPRCSLCFEDYALLFPVFLQYPYRHLPATFFLFSNSSVWICTCLNLPKYLSCAGYFWTLFCRQLLKSVWLNLRQLQ